LRRVCVDTSALVKLFVTEPDSAAVVQTLTSADEIATSVIAITELLATLARLHRDHRLNNRSYARTKARAQAQLATIPVLVAVNDALAYDGAALAETHGLRTLDALHLASALTVSADRGETFLFLTFDLRLSSAAAAEGLPIWPA